MPKHTYAGDFVIAEAYHNGYVEGLEALKPPTSRQIGKSRWMELMTEEAEAWTKYLIQIGR